MKRLFLGLFISALALGSFLERAISMPSVTESSRLRTDGIGSINVGMTIKEAEQVSGGSFVREGSYSENEACYYVSMQGLSDVSFMIIDRRIARVDINNPRISTLSGAKIGDSEERIYKLYPTQIKTTPHAYRGDHYLTFYPKDWQDRDYRVVFETNQGKVSTFRSGKVPAVEYIEGCS